MGRYVQAESLGNHRSVGYGLDIFEESPTEYRPIVTAQNSHGTTCSGFSDRRSFPTQEQAYEFAKTNEDLLCKEALADLKKSQKTIGSNVGHHEDQQGKESSHLQKPSQGLLVYSTGWPDRRTCKESCAH